MAYLMKFLSKGLSKGIVISIILLLCMAAFTACATKEKIVSPDVVKPLEPKAIKSISAAEEVNSYRVEIEGNRVLTYTSVKKPVPLGVVLYFPETVLAEAAFHTDIVSESNIVSKITAAELSSDGQSSKIEITLKQDVPYEVIRKENGLVVVFQKNSDSSLTADGRRDPVVKDDGTLARPVRRQPVIVVSKQDELSETIVAQPVQATV
jgi:hypothetical protein